ncbi:50S ribosomal protein L30 [bacterium]|nr:50S ribosomal protein L30 [bacterium]
MSKIRVTQVRSTIHQTWRQKRVVKALGLRKPHHSKVHKDSPMIRGMINKVSHLVKTESVEE